MVASCYVDPTACNRYANDEKEFIFCVKGRPFGCLVSPHLPTPTSSLIDYNLVRDLGIKMTDLQYTKFFFAGNKLRILGKVAITVQTIHDGLASGNFPFKANVILDLKSCLEIDTVAGVKLTKRLSGSADDRELDCTSSDAPSTSSRSPSGTPASSPSRSLPPSPSPTPTTPPRCTSPSPPTASRSVPSSPPGFPKQPQHNVSIKTARRPEIKVSLIPFQNAKPLSANRHALTETFHNADLMPTSNMELRALHEADPGGKLQLSNGGTLSFITMGGLTYVRGHGRNNKCSSICQDVPPDQIPHNCGYHRQWLIPFNFQPCGDSCEGAFCRCIDEY